MVKDFFIRGTTPMILFTLPFDFNVVEEVWLTVSQRRKEIFTKTKSDMKIEDSKISVTLTQQDTLSLDSDCKAEIQLRGRTTSGESFATKIKCVDVEAILKDGVI